MRRMIRAFVIALITALVVLVGLAALPVHAQSPLCTSLPDAIAALAVKYQEHPRVSGLTSSGSLMIITAAESGGWSVLLVSPDGQACMVASGASFEVLAAPMPGVDG